MDSEQAEQLTLIIKCVDPKRTHAAIATMTEDGMLTITGAEGDVLAGMFRNRRCWLHSLDSSSSLLLEVRRSAYSYRERHPYVPYLLYIPSNNNKV